MLTQIVLPRESDGLPQRWGIFSGEQLEETARPGQLTTGTRPNLRSIPALYPLPATNALSSTSSHLAAATTLLGLPPAGTYPPQSSSDGSLKPHIDVSATTGQVFVCTDGTPPGTSRRKSFSGRDRSEWLVVVEFEVNVQEIKEGMDEVYRVGFV